MTNTSLAESYLIKARVRLEVLEALDDATWVVSVAAHVIAPG